MTSIHLRLTGIACSICKVGFPDDDETIGFDSLSSAIASARADGWIVTADGTAVCTEPDNQHLQASIAHITAGLNTPHWPAHEPHTDQRFESVIVIKCDLCGAGFGAYEGDDGARFPGIAAAIACAAGTDFDDDNRWLIGTDGTAICPGDHYGTADPRHDDARRAWTPPAAPGPARATAVRTRHLGWDALQMSADAEWAGPGSRWANPYRIDRTGNDQPRETALAYAYYRGVYLPARPHLVEAARQELAGRTLACTCPADQWCHVDALLAVANDWPDDLVYPQRAQRSRAAGVPGMVEGSVYIGRPSVGSNPFTEADIRAAHPDLNSAEVRALCIRQFEDWLGGILPSKDHGMLRRRMRLLDSLEQLAGHRLTCWCGLDQPCHGDPLTRFVTVFEHCRTHQPNTMPDAELVEAVTAQ